MQIAFVLLAAGSGERLDAEVPKSLVKLDNLPLFIHSLIRCKEAGFFNQSILVVPEGFKEDFKSALFEHGLDVDSLVLGGSKRVESMSNALDAIKYADYVFIHDAARPFISVRLMEALLKEVQKHSAVMPALAVSSALKISKDGFAVRTLDRRNMYTVQTPQVFDFQLIKLALLEFKNRNIGDEVFDDSFLLELSGNKVRMIEGDLFNFKITYPQDLEFAKRILE
ncbi:MAG: 2-C-methyl-D-erythritol 4-phosphate cytidylyltransferase [Candidatus Kaelpia aquatica]|nr:2-C-methyl-D-erythritol 4-phosphate cytidylyltransferase [Candidatus Kaelpia aquatica]